MKKTFFLNFNQINRDSFLIKFSNSLTKKVSILDVGSGSSPYRNLFKNHEFKTHDFKQLSSDQLLHKDGYGQIDYVSDIEKIPVKNNSFDVIICTEVLEHVPNPIEALKEMARILKTGGKLLITTPLGSHIHQEPYHFYGGFTPFFYEKYLNEFSFKQISIVPNGGFYSFYFQESLRLINLSRKSPILILFLLLSLPFLIPFNFLLFLFRKILDNSLNDFKYTVGYHVVAIKNK